MRQLLIIGLALFGLSFQAQAFDHKHQALDTILQAHVAKGRVDYKGLKARSGSALKGYLDTLAAVKKGEFNGWNKNQRMAFLTNLYNAATLQLILDNYPVKSIKDIGGLFSGPWDQKVVRLWGKTTTLDHVEHKILRPQYGEAKLHFGLVCAAKGCPPLSNRAYTGSNFIAELDANGRVFLNNTAKNRVDTSEGELQISKIFDWFEEDFEKQSGSVEKFIAPYFPASQRAAILSGKLDIEYTDYDWSLNDKR